MRERTLRILEFQKIKDQLEGHASSALGKERVRQLVPSYNYEEIKKLQQGTQEAVTIERLKGTIPLGGIQDIRAHIKRATIGGMLAPYELLEIGSTLYATSNLHAFFDELLSEMELPIIEELTNRLEPLPSLEKQITASIGDNGEVLDFASPKLKGLRTQIRTIEGRIREKLEGYLRSSASKLSDTIVTIRNDRFVLPVKQEHRGTFGGIVHDQSSSGQTLFIEPASVVTLNNELAEARLNEKQEVNRILVELTAVVAVEAAPLVENVKALAEIDFLFAKAFYSRAIRATEPTVVDEPVVDLRQARHPLIPRNEVVANDIIIGKDYSVIVITGPNTGGKTVTLKTLGLCVYMVQAGLQVPAAEGSIVGVFKKIYADIGDEQSIEQSLSTFSSHMVHIVDILKDVDDRTLILFDELGAGTDPQEGAALAMAILDDAYGRGATIIATTHYPELKAYGYNREGIINASVEFDVNTLRPTYRLLLGVPGRSNAFEISKRLGLPEYIINSAKEYTSSESESVENMIASLEASKKAAEEERKETAHFRKSAEKLHQELQQKMVAYYEKKDEFMLNAKKEADELVAKAKEEADELVAELRKWQTARLIDVKEHEIIDIKKRLEEASPNITLSKKIPEAPKKERVTLQPGDEVKVVTFNQKGYLIEKVSNNEWLVSVGILKVKVKEKDMEYVTTPVVEKPKRVVSTVKGRSHHVGLELDLRGERFEDAMNRLEKYIDDALLAGHPRVSIIHGHGTGALRTGVQDYLKRHRQVKKHYYGHHNEGGLGVTIVEFK